MISALRRAVVAIGVAGLVAVVMKAQGGERLTPLHGGWRELKSPEFR